MSAISPPKRPALRARYERRRSALISLAAELFAERGYAATSMADVAQASDMTAGALYHYFPGKDDLLISIGEDLMDPLIELVEEVMAGVDEPADQLREFLRAWLLHYQVHRYHVRVVLQERLTFERELNSSVVRDKSKAFEDLLDSVLKAGEDDGTLVFDDRDLARSAVIGTVDHTPLWHSLANPSAAVKVADGYCDLLLRGIASKAVTGNATP